jgi:hypothetical protein
MKATTYGAETSSLSVCVHLYTIWRGGRQAQFLGHVEIFFGGGRMNDHIEMTMGVNRDKSVTHLRVTQQPSTAVRRRRFFDG